MSLFVIDMDSLISSTAAVYPSTSTGFNATLYITVEGTIQRTILRLLGSALGLSPIVDNGLWMIDDCGSLVINYYFSFVK